ncbi:MAG: EAL domain-containing protein [Rhodocyclaceae bacterium]|nr:EAL domain-containing protein [Rhodocyclaceae bacterium]
MRILLVEDNAGDARLIELLIDEARDAGRIGAGRVERVGTVREASARLESGGIDIILLDLSLPDAHGRETFEKIRNIAPDLPVVALTGNDDEQMAHDLVVAGAQDYLIKGQVDARLLARALRYAIERKRSEESLRLAVVALKRTEERMRHMAHHDALTGLPNRTLFQDRLEQAKALARRNKSRVALLFLDLDRFKLINDTLGHVWGDVLLKEAAERLRGCVREVDTVARLGGDEFAVVLGDLASREDAARVAEKILHVLTHSFHMNEQEVFVTGSVGIAVCVEGQEESEAGEPCRLVEQADIAMYHAKRSGRNSFHFYSPEMDSMSQENLAMEADLRRAVEWEEFLLHYQPQVDPVGHEIIGVEALIRWQHPTRGLVPPAEFIPFLEDTGLIVPVGEWVMRTACRQAKAWIDEGLPSLRMAVNLSARQLHRPDLVDRVAAILDETGFPPHLLEIELTESIVMENTAEAAAALSRLKTLGVRIALDDFGTGASSLGYLKHFPIDTLKISSAVIFDVEREVDAAIAGAVIAMARNMRVDSIAEGVETQNQLDFLRRERCDSIQGYLISRPVAPEKMKELLIGLSIGKPS